MRVGIMGGTLDPVHMGHIQIAETALHELQLDRIMLLPAGDPPHKAHPTPKADRWRMAQLAAETVPGMFACDAEISRAGVTYTVDTLREMHIYQPDTQWYYLIGADTLDVLDSWRSFDQVAKMCTFVVAGRGAEKASAERMAFLADRYGARFTVLSVSGPEISSSEIRDRTAKGQDIRGLTTENVRMYIEAQGLYLCPYSTDAIRDMLRAHLKIGRYQHTLSVAETARRLAARYGVSPARAYLAGLLHDCAKYMDADAQRAMLRQSDLPIDDAEMAADSVLHAPVGALLAESTYGVRDMQILSAIRKHTIGDAEMSMMDALIYTADFIEPNRKPFPGLAEARALAEQDIYAAMCQCARLTCAYVRESGAMPHPKTIKMIQNYQADKQICNNHEGGNNHDGIQRACPEGRQNFG